jgi:hypothetical protein
VVWLVLLLAALALLGFFYVAGRLELSLVQRLWNGASVIPGASRFLRYRGDGPRDRI